MSKESLLKEFCELVAIPVQSKDERAICDVLKAKLEEIDLSIYEDRTAEKVGGNTGNVLAVLKGNVDAPAVLFSSHMDRVKNPGKITPMIDEEADIIRSDGTSILAADDVSGIVAILDCLRTIKASGVDHGDIEVAFSVCEEIGVQGSKHMDFIRFKAKQAYVVDCPGRIGKIVTQAPTKCKIVVHVKGIKAHAGNEPEKGLNAIKVAATALAQMPEGHISPEVTSNFGMISGGAGTNVVCDSVTITGEARGTDDEVLICYLEKVKAIFAKTAEQFKTEIEVTVNLLYHTFRVVENAPVVQTLLQAMRQEGIEGHCTAGGGGSDGNHFNWNGIPAVVMALGYSKNHTNAEQIYYDDIYACSRVLRHVVEITAKQR